MGSATNVRPLPMVVSQVLSRDMYTCPHCRKLVSMHARVTFVSVDLIYHFDCWHKRVVQ